MLTTSSSSLVRSLFFVAIILLSLPESLYGWLPRHLPQNDRLLSATTARIPSSLLTLSMVEANGSSSNDNNNDIDGEEGSHRYLFDAGKSLVLAADAINDDNNDACVRLLRDAGTSFTYIGESWSTSWEGVTYEASDASSYFFSLAQVQEDQNGAPALAKAYSQIGNELRSISNIGGCTSVGPPSSVPNLIGISSHFNQLADLLGNNNNDDDDGDDAVGNYLRDALESIRLLAEEYDS